MKCFLPNMIVITFLISGCVHTTIGRKQIAEDAKIELIGKSKKEILLCVGAPDQQLKEEDLDILTYYSGKDFVIGQNAAAGKYCKIDFFFDAGKVVQINYSGRTGGVFTEGEQCAFALENCLK